jgi:hypothetical protein
MNRALDRIAQGWHLGWHSRMGSFYTFDPAAKEDTFGRDSVSRAEVKKLLKDGVIEKADQLGLEYRPAVKQA